MNNGNEEEIDFLFEEVEQFKLSITIDDKPPAFSTSNDLEYLKSIYDNLVDEYINSPKHIIVSIFDYNKNTYIYSYDSDDQ